MVPVRGCRCAHLWPCVCMHARACVRGEAVCAPRPATSGGRRAAKATTGVRPSPPPVAEKDPSTKHTCWWENVPNSAYPGSPERETGHTAAASHRALSGPERRRPQMGRNTPQELRNPSQALVPADGAVSCLEAGGGNTPHGATAAIPSAAPAPPVPHADLEAMGGTCAGKDQEACPACPAERPAQASQPWSVKPELVMAVPEPLDSPREGGHQGIYILLSSLGRSSVWLWTSQVPKIHFPGQLGGAHANEAFSARLPGWPLDTHAHLPPEPAEPRAGALVKAVVGEPGWWRGAGGRTPGAGCRLLEGQPGG